MPISCDPAARFGPRQSSRSHKPWNVPRDRHEGLNTEIAFSAGSNLLKLGGIWSLPPGTVDIWLARIRPLPSKQLAAWLRLMSEDELYRYDRFVSAETQLQHVTARVLVRTALSCYANVAPEAWRFGVNAYGRPAIVEPRKGHDLRFNLSHTEGLVALAVAETRDVGIDVEQVGQEINVATLATSMMAQAELEALEATLPGPARRDLFFTFWTLKEAFVKARGVGLSLPLDGIIFDLSQERTSVAFDPSLIIDDATQWLFHRFSPTPLHVLAVAANGSHLVPRIRWASPTLF